MTRIGQVCADLISENPPNPRHPRSISSLISTRSERFRFFFWRLGVLAPLRETTDHR
jgi:hypothetical protein